MSCRNQGCCAGVAARWLYPIFPWRRPDHRRGLTGKRILAGPDGSPNRSHSSTRQGSSGCTSGVMNSTASHRCDRVLERWTPLAGSHCRNRGCKAGRSPIGISISSSSAGARSVSSAFASKRLMDDARETADKVADLVVAHVMSPAFPFFVGIRPPSPSQPARARAAIFDCPLRKVPCVSSTLRPSAIVGCVRMASRRAVYGSPAIIAVCTTASTSPASAPGLVNPSMRSLSASSRIFMNPRVSPTRGHAVYRGHRQLGHANRNPLLP